MATSMKSKATKTVAEEKTSTVDVETNTEVNVSKTVAAKANKKIYEPSDGIPCKSITSGSLFMEGLKSHIVYEWVDNGDTVEVEYQDLIAAIRSNNGYIIKPFFVIEDEELVSQFPQLKKIYETLYSVGDLRTVLTDLNPSDMKATILSLPSGAQESIKHIASQMISNGSLDSVKKIKVLDEIYDTEMSIMTGLFDI